MPRINADLAITNFVTQNYSSPGGSTQKPPKWTMMTLWYWRSYQPPLRSLWIFAASKKLSTASEKLVAIVREESDGAQCHVLLRKKGVHSAVNTISWKASVKHVIESECYYYSRASNFHEGLFPPSHRRTPVPHNFERITARIFFFYDPARYAQYRGNWQVYHKLSTMVHLKIT